MIDLIAEKVAVSLKQSNPEKTASIAVMKFALIPIINALVVILISIICSFLLKDTLETCIAICSFAILRYFSGGIHLKSSLLCALLSSSIIIVISKIHIEAAWVLALTLLSMVCVSIWAPSNIKGYGKINEKYYPLLKIIALLIVSSNLMFLSSTVALIFTIQALSITPMLRRWQN